MSYSHLSLLTSKKKTVLSLELKQNLLHHAKKKIKNTSSLRIKTILDEWQKANSISIDNEQIEILMEYYRIKSLELIFKIFDCSNINLGNTYMIFLNDLDKFLKVAVSLCDAEKINDICILEIVLENTYTCRKNIFLFHAKTNIFFNPSKAIEQLKIIFPSIKLQKTHQNIIK